MTLHSNVSNVWGFAIRLTPFFTPEFTANDVFDMKDAHKHFSFAYPFPSHESVISVNISLHRVLDALHSFEHFL